MLIPLPTPAEMAVWDRATIDTIGIPGVTLMESASREAVDVLLKEYGPIQGCEIHCYAGAGNNGGDAFAMARHLLDLGADVTVFHTKPKKQYRGEARTNLLWAQKVGVPLMHLATTGVAALPQPDIIIDGLLGTGFQGELRTDILDLIRIINRSGEKAFVLALDIPSGLNGLTGEPQPDAIKADATISFQAAKLGLTMPGATRFTGLLHVRPIGIPATIQTANPVHHHLITGDVMDAIPSSRHDMHKGSAGHVLIVGGSEGLTGAPHLAALGALRSGAGLVTVACPAGLADSVKAGSPDIMTLPLLSGTEWTPEMANIILRKADRFDCAVIGPGLGRSRKTLDFIGALIARWPSHVVLDADGLFALAETPNVLQTLPDTMVLTPHPGEMARLLDTDTATIQNDRLAVAQTFTEHCAAILILKGAGTLVADTAGIRLSPFSEPNLAIGGSGDVLSGIIGSLLARGMDTVTASCLGVYWHGLTGRMLREEFPARGNLASDIANTLPHTAATTFKE